MRERLIPGERSISEVLTDIVRNIQDIIRFEIHLAEAEVRERLRGARASGSHPHRPSCGRVQRVLPAARAFTVLSRVMVAWAAGLCIGSRSRSSRSCAAAGVRRLRTVQPAPLALASVENVEWAKPGPDRNAYRNQARRFALESQELEDKVKSVTDWRQQFRSNPGLMLARLRRRDAARGVRGRARPRAHPVNADRPALRPAPLDDRKAQIRHVWDEIQGALIGVATSRIANTLVDVVPGFGRISARDGRHGGAEALRMATACRVKATTAARRYEADVGNFPLGTLSAPHASCATERGRGARACGRRSGGRKRAKPPTSRGATLQDGETSRRQLNTGSRPRRPSVNRAILCLRARPGLCRRRQGILRTTCVRVAGFHVAHGFGNLGERILPVDDRSRFPACMSLQACADPGIERGEEWLETLRNKGVSSSALMGVIRGPMNGPVLGPPMITTMPWGVSTWRYCNSEWLPTVSRIRS